MKLSDLKIETQLKGGFLIILTLILVLGAVSWTQANKLKQQTSDLYEHPLMVIPAIGELKSDVLLMQLWMRELVLKTQEKDWIFIRQKLDTYKAHAYKKMDVLEHQYAGPANDVDKAYDCLVQWNSVNDRIFQLVAEGKKVEAMNYLTYGGVSNLKIEALFHQIDVVHNFAKANSKRLSQNSISVHRMLSRNLFFWILAILIIILILFYSLLGSIRNPLAEINSAISRFREGDLSARSKWDSKNEYGILSTNFNHLADTVQDVRMLNERAIKLNQLMLSEEDAHRFCFSILAALVEDTKAQMGAVYLLNEEKTNYVNFETIGMLKGACKPFSAKYLEGEFGEVLVTKRMQHLTDIPEDSRFTFATVTGEFQPREIVTLPVVNGSEVVAILSLAKVNAFSPSSLNLLHMIQSTLNARMGGILANRKILTFSQKLEFQNIELETQKNELASQTSELLEQNMELEMQKKELNESNKLKTTFLSNMSHELRTPLNSVIALSGVLNRRLSGKVPAEEYSYLEVIERNGKSLLKLINDILDLSRIESGKEELDLTRFNLSDLVGELVEMIDPQARQKNIALRVVDCESLPMITTDYEKLRHILQNLIGNAVKFTEEGYVEIAYSMNDQEVLVDIQDTGIGIQDKDLIRIFDEFRQADGSNSRKYGGTGLGLSIAKKYAQMLGGRIELDSVFGKGSHFRLSFPLTCDDNSTTESMSENLVPPLRVTEIVSDLRDKSVKNILIVEDTNAVVIQMKDILESHGYNLSVASNGKEALEQLAVQVPDGMILDLMMPGVDGFEVLKRIRQEKLAESLPVIILTAKYITKEELSFLKTNHIHQLIHKGDINKDQLLQAVASMVYVAAPNTEPLSMDKPLPIHTDQKSQPVVLVVEDNADNMLTIKALLDGKCNVLEAENGRDGIEKACRHHPNLILMDIALPGINGIEALQELRKDKSMNTVPIVAVSASAMKGDKEKLIAYGFNGYLSKPIDEKQFTKTIEEWIGSIQNNDQQ